MELGNLIAWVADVDEPRGRAVALALSSRGARVLVTGADERAIAECVGEIAHAGGKARHFVGDARSERGAKACLDAAAARFGGVHVAVIPADSGAVPVVGAVRVVTVDRAHDDVAAVSAVLARIASFDAN